MTKKWLAAGAMMLALGAAACGGGGSGSNPSPVQTLAGPPSVAQVARILGADHLTVCGAAPAGGVTDSGTAYRGGVRIGINIFPSTRVRDQWIKNAQNYGVTVRWQGAAWAAYPAVDQHAKGCH